MLTLALPWHVQPVYRFGVVELPGNLEADVFAIPDEGAGYVRTGDETAVPTRIRARVLVQEPAIEISMFVQVDGGGRAYVRQFQVVVGDLNTAVTTTLLRRLPVDAILREVLERATLTAFPRPDVNEHAFQVPGDPENQAWVSRPPASTHRGKRVSGDRVERAAQIYLEALASGSKAPAEVVAAKMGYSRATAARDIRAARERRPPLLPPPGSQLAPVSEAQEWPPPGATGRISGMPREEFVRRAEELGLRGPGPTGKRMADLTPGEREEMAARFAARDQPGTETVDHPGVPNDKAPE